MKRKEIRIRDCDNSLKETLSTYAKNKGQTRAEFLRPYIRVIAESFPKYLKEERDIKKSELSVSGISEDVIKDLEIIAANLGVSLNQLLQIKFHELSKELPDWMKINTDPDS